MSVRAINRVFEASQHGGSELLMLVVLADYSDDGGNSYPSVASLARKCRMTPRNANYILGALQASGELRVLKNQGPGGTNRYRLMLDQMGATPLKPASPLKATSPPEAGFTPEEPFTLKPASRTPEAGFSKPLKPASDEPSLNRQEPSSAARKRAGVDPAGFAEFWTAWPATDRKTKRKDCAAHWKRHSLVEHLADILAHVQAMMGTRKWRDGFEPAPLTYLRGECWNDGAPATAHLPATRGLDCEEQIQ